jgi:hypothetical protein
MDTTNVGSVEISNQSCSLLASSEAKACEQAKKRTITIIKINFT